MWTLGCMGMNDAYLLMEGKGHKTIDKMARLTWWRHNTKNGYYENVISRRKISNKDWKPAWAKFVQLKEDTGNSYSKDFEAGSSPSSAGPGATEGSGSVDNPAKKTKAITFEPPAANVSATTPSGNPKASPKQCKVNNRGPYSVKEQDKRYYLFIDKKWLPIEKDGKNYDVEYNGKIWPLEMIG
jgi:hypothetical protein